MKYNYTYIPKQEMIPVIALKKLSIEQAGKLPNQTIQEKLSNADKIYNWLKQNK